MALVSALPKLDSPAALAPLREHAWQALQRSGLPTKKTEAWRFTPIQHLVARDYPPAEVTDASGGWARPDEGCRALFRGSRLLPPFTAPHGLQVHGLADAPAALLNRIGSIATNEHFVALNSASFVDALLLVAQSPVETLVEIDYEAFGAAPAYPRVLVVVEPGARLRLVERGFGQSALGVPVTEIALGAGATLEHMRVHSDAGALLGTVAIAQEQGSRYHSLVATFGGAPLRLDLDVHLVGPGAEARLDGIYLADRDEHLDHHVRVDHMAPHCRSEQRYRGVLDGKGTAVFDGQAFVRRTAPTSEAHQHNRNLLLSDRANVFTKPHLEIDHDDVIASHGATVGALDDGQLFYLRSRGIPARVARGLLTYAFLEEIVEAAPIAAIRQELTEGLLARLPESGTLRMYFEEVS